MSVAPTANPVPSQPPVTQSPVPVFPAVPSPPVVAIVTGALSAGCTAPDFELPDHAGNPYRLARERAAAGTDGGAVVIVFFRGHWCPYCRRYLSKLQANLPRVRAGGGRLVAVSPEPPETSRDLVAQLGLAFPVLSDADGRVIAAYGTRNGFLGSRSLLPHPSVFVVDAGGIVRFRSVDRNFKRRTTVRSLLAALAEVSTLGGAAPRQVAPPDLVHVGPARLHPSDRPL